MIPLFKSHYSLGKSILSLEVPTATLKPERNIISLIQKAGLDKLVLVEDSLTGFLQAKKVSESAGIQLVFGLRLSCCDDATGETTGREDATAHKIIIFSRNDAGCRLLNKIYSWAFTNGEGRIDMMHLKKFWDSTALKLAIPFYDSFIFNNLMSFKNCVVDFSTINPTFFLESNDLPFDMMVRESVLKYAIQGDFPTEETQSIYYSTQADFSAYQTRKCIHKRASFGNATLSKPNLDHCASDQFSFESWHKKTRG